ncbi:MAG TPA: RNase H-like domain-containing protein, partial [Puia sp.]|nr:RNase H-like domain-containing protein [Puia sp.]
MAEPLSRLTRSDIAFEWTQEQQDAFEAIKKALMSRPVLVNPDYTKPFHLFVDASLVAQGGALTQQTESKDYQAIGYWSRIISAPERKWPAVQLELNAIVMALRHFAPYVYGTEVIVHTDHRPLIYLMKKKAAHANLPRWAIELMQYNLVLEHIDGKRNRVADALSRIAEDLTLEDIANVPESEDIAEFPRTLYMLMEEGREQVEDEEWQQESNDKLLEAESVSARVTSSRNGVTSGELESEVMVIDGPTKEAPVFEIVSQGNVMFSRQSLCDLQSESLELGKVYRLLQIPLDEEVYDKVSEVEIWYLNNCRVENGLMIVGPIQSYRIIAPEGVRRELFDYAHTSRLTGGHFALKKTHLRIKRFYWHGMLNDFKKWIQYCKECQERNGRPQDVPLMPSRISRVFEKLGADYCGP